MAEQEKRVARLHPFHDLGLFETWPPRIARSLDELLPERARLSGLVSTPLDVTETDEAYVVSIELAGIDKNDLNVECKDGVLSIRGEKKSEREEKTEKARVLERHYGAFHRSISLPADADAEHVHANFKDGLLRIEIQKRPEAKPKTIAIKG